MFVCAAAAVAAAVVVGMFPTAWFATDPNSKTPPKEATSMDQLDPEQIAGLLKRGRELIAAGDVALARLVLKRGASAERVARNRTAVEVTHKPPLAILRPL